MFDIKKIITALANPTLYEELIKTAKYDIPIKDIQYQEGLIEYITNCKNIDIIIISELLPGSLSKEELILKIKEINNNIKIMILLDKYNEKYISFLNEQKIFNVFLDSEINLEKILKIIEEDNDKYINIPEELIEEINYLKNMVTKKTNFLNRFKNILNKLKKNKRKNLLISTRSSKDTTFFNYIISIVGAPGVRKIYFYSNFRKFYGKKLWN